MALPVTSEQEAVVILGKGDRPGFLTVCDLMEILGEKDDMGRSNKYSKQELPLPVLG